MNLEKMLNRLIEMGRKPRGYKQRCGIYYEIKHICLYEIDNSDMRSHRVTYSQEDLCSIDSGLFQFVCEKGLYNKETGYPSIDFTDGEGYTYRGQPKSDFEYRLMLSSIQQDKSAFLLDSIQLPDDPR